MTVLFYLLFIQSLFCRNAHFVLFFFIHQKILLEQYQNWEMASHKKSFFFLNQIENSDR